MLLNDIVSTSEVIKHRIVWMWAYNNLTDLGMEWFWNILGKIAQRTEKNHEKPVKIVGVPSEIRTEHFVLEMRSVTNASLLVSAGT
jgi:hypothetical protein